MGISLYVPCLHAQTHIGIEGEGLGSNMPGNSSGGPSGILSQPRSPRLAFGGGLWADIRLSDYLDFQPHIDIAPRGARIWHNGQATGYFHMTYLELPARLMYRVPVGYDDFFIGGGLYAALGLRGNYHTTVSTPTAPSHDLSGDIHFTDPDAADGLHFKNWDAGYTAAVSYQFSFGIALHLSYVHGFVNIAPAGTGRVVNQSLSLGIGYLFHYNTRD